MQDHEFPPLEQGAGAFEKRVHQKLSEMELAPSEDIWERLDERLHPQKKRRPLIAWMLLLLAGLGISGYLVWNSTFLSNNTKKSLVAKNKINTIGKNVTPTPFNKKETSKAIESGETRDSGVAETLTGEKEKSVAILKNKQSSPNHNKESPSDIAAIGSTSQVVTQKTLAPAPTSPGRSELLPFKTTGKNSDGKNKQVIPPGKHQQLNLASTTTEGRYAGTEKTLSEMETAPTSTIELEPALVVVSPAIPVILINTSLGLQNDYPLVRMSATNVNSPVKLKERRGLSWGFTMQGGRSIANNGSLNSLFQSSAVYDANNAFASANPNANANYPPPSTLKAGPAFSAGLFVRKELTRRISLSAGINYALYTLSNQVGAKIDSTIIVPAAIAPGQKAIEEFYRVGSSQKYMNRYHFIEIPVLLRAKLTARDRIPVSFDLGFSISRLISTNALHFDAGSRIYYSNIELFNRTQVNLVTGLPVRIFSKNKFSVEAGPHLQYGITNLLANQQTGGKHFLFVGVKAGIQIGKK